MLISFETRWILALRVEEFSALGLAGLVIGDV
jgi:hypothetical protein